VRTYIIKEKQRMQKNTLTKKYLIYISIIVLIVLQMFQNAITDETFRKNVQTYLYKQ